MRFRPGASVALAATARTNSPTPPPPFRTAKVRFLPNVYSMAFKCSRTFIFQQVLERPVSPVIPLPVVAKVPVKKIHPPSSASGPSTSSAQV